MELTFGARLRQQREQQHVTLTAISAATKIKVSLLQELESDNVSHWPTGLYRRSYLRDYARAIGLDPEGVVREFHEIYPDPAAAAEPGQDGDADVPPPQETGLRRLFASVLRPRMDGDRAAERLAATRMLIAQEASAEPFLTEDIAEADDRPAPAPEPAVTVVLRPEAEVHPISLGAIADLCTRLARAVDGADIQPVLADAARLLDAVGVIVWAWDPRRTVLAPVLAHGYAHGLLARLPGVSPDAGNAIAAAFRSSEPCIVFGNGGATGALVVPMMAPAGCAGAVAFELHDGAEQDEAVAAAARILAAQLAALVGVAPMTEAVNA